MRKRGSFRRYSSVTNSVSGVPTALSRARALLRQQLGSAALSRFRQLTHQPTRGLLSFPRKARDSSQSGALSLKNLQARIQTPLDICRQRKQRREVLFAKGKQGGNHKPPTYTFKSLVRC